MRHPLLVCAVLASASLTTLPSVAASRTFKATLAKVSDCTFADATGSISLTIDDASGAVTGSLTVAGFPKGGTISGAGIRNKNAGDNLVGDFAGIPDGSENGTFAVTTTLNAIALPKILGGDGAVLVQSSKDGSGCNIKGAIRGDLVEDTGAEPVDGGGSSTSSSTSSSSGVTTQPSGTSSSSGSDAGAAPVAAPAAEDGCSTSGSPASGIWWLAGIGLAVATLRRARRS